MIVHHLLSTAENPVCLEESYRIEVLVLLRRLERLDQDVYQEDERQEAEEVKIFRVIITSFLAILLVCV